MTIAPVAIAAAPPNRAPARASQTASSGESDFSFGHELDSFTDREPVSQVHVPKQATTRGDGQPANGRASNKKNVPNTPAALKQSTDASLPVAVAVPVDLEFPNVETAPPAAAPDASAPAALPALPTLPTLPGQPETSPDHKPEAPPKARATDGLPSQAQEQKPESDHTAIAVRVQPVNRIANPSKEWSAKRPAETEPEESEPTPTSIPGNTALAANAFAENSRLSAAPSAAAAPLAAERPLVTEVVTPHTETVTKPAEPLRALSIDVGGANANERVQLRVVQESGELHVAVRTGDTQLAHGLQQGLPDLVGKLQEGGYRADGWKPVTTLASTPAAAESQGSSNQSAQRDGQSHSGGSQQQEGRQNHNQSNQPRWVQELESSLSSSEKS